MDNKTQISLKSIIWISDIRALKSWQSMDVMGIMTAAECYYSSSKIFPVFKKGNFW